MKHFKHAALAIFWFAVGMGPLLLGSPAVQNFIANHPADAVYVTAVVGFLRATKKWLDSRKATPA